MQCDQNWEGMNYTKAKEGIVTKRIREYIYSLWKNLVDFLYFFWIAKISFQKSQQVPTVFIYSYFVNCLVVYLKNYSNNLHRLWEGFHASR